MPHGASLSAKNIRHRLMRMCNTNVHIVECIRMDTIRCRKGKSVQIKMFLPLHQSHTESATFGSTQVLAATGPLTQFSDPSIRETFITSQHCGLCTCTWRNVEGLF